MLLQKSYAYGTWKPVNLHNGVMLENSFTYRILTVVKIWVLYDNLAVWWTAKTVVHYEFLPRGQTSNTDAYHRQLNEFHWKLRIKQSALVNKSGPIILYEGVRPHVSVGSRCASGKQFPNQDALILEVHDVFDQCDVELVHL
ncbi:hypothetical protein TNCV_4425781 [Trichonephila clavipes]|nr:hypothetical protein TNCV_4425781 [Trichonephila clavipes]